MLRGTALVRLKIEKRDKNSALQPTRATGRSLTHAMMKGVTEEALRPESEHLRGSTCATGACSALRGTVTATTSVIKCQIRSGGRANGSLTSNFLDHSRRLEVPAQLGNDGSTFKIFSPAKCGRDRRSHGLASSCDVRGLPPCPVCVAQAWLDALRGGRGVRRVIPCKIEVMFQCLSWLVKIERCVKKGRCTPVVKDAAAVAKPLAGSEGDYLAFGYWLWFYSKRDAIPQVDMTIIVMSCA